MAVACPWAFQTLQPRQIWEMRGMKSTSTKKKWIRRRQKKSIDTAGRVHTRSGYHELSSPARAPCTKALWFHSVSSLTISPTSTPAAVTVASCTTSLVRASR